MIFRMKAQCLLSTAHRWNTCVSSVYRALKPLLLASGLAGRGIGSCSATHSQRVLHVAVQRIAYRAPVAGCSLLRRLWADQGNLAAACRLPGLFSARYSGRPLSSHWHLAARRSVDLPSLLPAPTGTLRTLRRLAGAHPLDTRRCCAAGGIVRGLR